MVSNIKKIQNDRVQVRGFSESGFSSSALSPSQTSSKNLLFKFFTFFLFIYVINLYFVESAYATNYHIAVNGKSSGDGSRNNPWDMVTGISGRGVLPGDTIFIHGGVYKGKFKSYLKGSSGKNIVLAQFPGEVAILDGNAGESATETLAILGSYATYYGFQVMSSNSKRTSSISGSRPTDLFQNDGISLSGPNNLLVNLIVRDNIGEGIGFWKRGASSEVYGCIIYNNGWQGPDRGHGHGIYSQNDAGTGTKVIRDNVIFGGFGRGIQIYGVNGGLDSYNINGNIIFNAGALARSPSWNIIIGGESRADNILVQNNILYKDYSAGGSNVQLHYGSTINGKATFQNNYVVGGEASVSIKNWERSTVTGNIIYGRGQVLDYKAAGSSALSSFNNNTYFTPNTTKPIANMTFDSWKSTYGWDGNSRMQTSTPSNQVVVKPSVYEKGTGFVVVVNNSGSGSVDVDLSRILSNGAEYEIRDVENMQGQPILSGKYSGGTVRLPMNLTSVDKPNGISTVKHSSSGLAVFSVRTKGKVNSTAPVVVTNQPPTLNAITNPAAINENAGAQTINLSGISAGPGETQTLKVIAVSSNTGLIPNPTVSYSSPSATGSISYTPVANKTGTATITVTVDDGASSNSKISRTFTVTVNAVNKAPELNAISNITVDANSGSHSVNLSGISAGVNETQTISITASSSNTGIIPNPSITYSSPATTGKLNFTTVDGKSGSATITVTVKDNGSGSAPNVNEFKRSFTITVKAPVVAVNKAPTLNNISDVSLPAGAPKQSINLGGISAGEGESQTLTVTASSSNTGLIPNPSVTYSSPAQTGKIEFTPVAGKSGTATITITVKDNGSGTAPNVNEVKKTFKVTVAAPEVVVPVNKAPTLNNMSDISLAANAPKQTVNLGGITAGAGENQTLTVTASSSNTGLIPNPSVTYSSPAQTGKIEFTPVAGKSGTATITITVKDNGSGTAPNVNEIKKTFKVTVAAPVAVDPVVPVNKAPTLNSISDITIKENAAKQTVSLGGITAGAGENQTLTVTSTSSNTGLIGNPSIIYRSPDQTGKLEFTPVANKIGTVTITVKVKDNGSGTAPNQNEFTRTFKVTIIKNEDGGNDGGSPETPDVTKLTLVNAVNHNTLFELKDGMTIYTSKLPVRLDQLSVEAFVSQAFDGSILFGFNNNSRYVIENYAIYAINGNTGNQYNKWDGLKPGVHTITATSYSNKGATGSSGRTTKVTVTVVDDRQVSAFGDAISLQLINAKTNVIMYTLTEGLVIDMKDLPVALDQLNIRAITSSTNAGSLVFGFNGNSRYNVESVAPYVIGGNTKDNYYSWNGLKVGKHTVTATTYQERGGKGKAGNPLTVNFTIVDSRSASSRTAPQVSSIKRSIAEDEPYNFKKEDFNTAFVDASGEPLNKVKVVSLPATGELEYYGQSVRAGEEFSLEEIANLVYVPGNEVNNDDSFKWNGSNGQLYASQEASVKLIPSKEAEERIKFEVVRFWPNPVVDQVTIRAVSPMESTVDIVVNNINGQLVKRVKSHVEVGENEIELDLSGLDGGVYVVSMINGFSTVNFKIIKNVN